MDRGTTIGLTRRMIVGFGLAAFLAVWAVVHMPAAARGAEARRAPPVDSNVVHTVTASVEYSTERITGKQVMRVPGEFTVPEGAMAGQFRYRWADTKTGRESDRITATTVYSVTQRRYMSELKDNPNATLPPGDYKLVVGGLPGAIGNLTYRLMPQADPVGPTADSGDRIIDVETWLTKAFQGGYNPKFKATYVIRQGKVTGTMDQIVEPPKYEHGITCDPMPHKGTFAGRIEGNVITGNWEVRISPHKMYLPASNKQPAYDRTDSSTLKYEIRLTLNADGSVSQTTKGAGETRATWSSSAPRELANKTDSYTFDFNIPGEDIPDPLTGRWKQRTGSQESNK